MENSDENQSQKRLKLNHDQVEAASSVPLSVGNQNDITFEIVRNTGTQDAVVKLIALKNIFSKQLPKMPKEYIVRLVFDHRHISLAILRQGRTIGGICYRPYLDQRFGEIAFCAINSNEQVKGYGSILMNHLKAHVQKDKIEYFLTYADNFAIGYFQKQGFSKHVAMPKDRWVGFIKDYDGGTLMECYVHPAMDYLHVSQVVAKQRAFIFERLKQNSQANTIYPGLELFRSGKRLQSVLELPGVTAAGWSSYHIYHGSTERDRNVAQSKLSTLLKSLLDKVRSCDHAWPFVKEISAREYPTYTERIQNPVDLQIVLSRLRMNDYYRSKEAMGADLHRMVNNTKEFFGEGADVWSTAHELGKVISELFPADHTGSALTSVEAGGGGGSSSSTSSLPAVVSKNSLNA